jgi:hypothetical protein
MVRLEKQDLADRDQLTEMAACTSLTADQFLERFGYVVGIGPRPF